MYKLAYFLDDDQNVVATKITSLTYWPKPLFTGQR